MAAARGCDAVLRLLDSEEANPPAYNLLCRYLALLDGEESAAATARATAPRASATALAFRLKLALAAGFAPELASCARCGEADGLVGFSGAAGGVVCAACERGGFELSAEAHEFMVEALGRPLAGRAGGVPARRCARPSGRSPRRSSTTPTCACAPRRSAPPHGGG